MFDFLFGADIPLAVRFFIAFVVVLGLIGGTAFWCAGSAAIGSAAPRPAGASRGWRSSTRPPSTGAAG